ncbi:hypothetical protein FKW77_006506 [Venturia effusa]|uniref:BHLH domain-containing protein n=1 Tax=Venturia effusa TaxID=50376 RepID=A0A517LAZ2_9PEZI|nr:hypothetical protein FKW77_006506 [Venturia effusa]
MSDDSGKGSMPKQRKEATELPPYPHLSPPSNVVSDISRQCDYRRKQAKRIEVVQWHVAITDMPLAVQAQQWSPYSATFQSQAASEQTALSWTQGEWQQQQLEDGSCWMRVDEINASQAMNAERTEKTANSRQEWPPSMAWSGRRAQQNTDNTACFQTNGSMAEWAAPESWQTSLATQGGSPIISERLGKEFETLPLFLESPDLPIPEPLSVSSSSLSSDPRSRPSQLITTAEPPSKRTSLKRSPSSEHSDNTVDVEDSVKPKPRRGRPRLPQGEPHVCDNLPCEHVMEESASRVPHNQVEQKYRNGINAGLERLRETVAIAPSRAFAHLSNAFAKPSKAMVLASAIDYIKSIEAERDQLADENEVLRGRNKRLRREKKEIGNDQ